MKRDDATNATDLVEPGHDLEDWARLVLDAAFEVHRVLGPGFVESIYERAMCVELNGLGVPFLRQVPTVVEYKGTVVGRGEPDLLVADQLVVELKAVDILAPIHWVQLRSYLKATRKILGLLINFNVPLLKQGIRRIVLSDF